MGKAIKKDQIVAELVKHGWQIAPKDIAHAVIARKEVKTFKGTDFANIAPIIVFEGGDVAVMANFTSRGENVLALCRAFIKDNNEIPSQIAAFHEDVMKNLSQAFSVRMAS